MTISLAEILSNLEQEYEVMGDQGISINGISPATSPAPGTLVWLTTVPHLPTLLEQSPASLFMLPLPPPSQPPAIPPGKAIVFVQDSRLAAITILSRFFKQRPGWGIHPSATVHPEATIHPETYIGPNSYVGKCTIGQGTILYGNNYLYDGIRTGRHVIVHAGAVIGADGFGYHSGNDKEWLKFEHLGGVEIGNGVEIGANTCIDRGTLGDTKIGDGTKIDNLVHIAHNVTIGRHCLVIAHAMIGGSCTIGDHCWIAPHAGIHQKITIGTGVTIGLGAVVLEDVPAGETWAGVPAHRLHRKNNNPAESA